MNAEQYKRGWNDRTAGQPRCYGCHFGMRSTLEADRAAYVEGYNSAEREIRTIMRQDGCDERAAMLAASWGDEA